MRNYGLLGVFLALVAPVFAGDPIPQAEYAARRAKLQKTLEGPLVLFGRTEGSDEVFRRTQEPNLYYLTGWTEPGAILLMTSREQVLFLPHRNARREIYMGHHVSPGDADACQKTGFDSVMPIERFESQFAKALEAGHNVYALADGPDAARLKVLAPMRDITPAGPLIAKLRVIKSEAELAAIRRATDVSVRAQEAAWKRVHPGAGEYEAVGAFMDSLLSQGCEGPAYSPIFGSGPNSTVLHYSADSRRMDAGETLVIDAAAECGGYASDITRTLPVGGKFTPRQRELYEIVLGAQKAAIAAVKPGAKLESLTSLAREYLDAHGKDLHGNPLGKYLPHGVSHNVGLDVHDPMGADALAPGMVITIEPGVYLPEEHIGIRIEDTLLVTKNGATVLSAALPKEPDEIEKALAH